MRQGQQNRRGRGRNNNNNQNNQQRKGQNPLTRSFESNGPDVKLRGTPAHIAEKYLSLARDALSAGDPVLAENYLQHAEHYNRIIMAYREQQVSQGGDPGFNGGYNPPARTDSSFGSDTDAEDGLEGTAESPLMVRQGLEQPRLPEHGGERRFEDRPQRTHGEHRPSHQQRDRDRPYQGDRGFDRRDRPDRFDRSDRPDRYERNDRHERMDRQDRGDRPERSEHREHRGDRERSDRFERPPSQGGEARMNEPRPEGAQPARRRDRPLGDRLSPEASEQPEFLRRPVRRPRREDQEEAGAAVAAPAVAASEDSE